MATVTETRPASKPITVAPASPDPWYEDMPVYAVPVASLVFGARVTLCDKPGRFKVVRAAERRDSTCRYRVRIREEHANGSLVGPVLSLTLDQVAGLVTDAAVPQAAAPAPVPVPVQVETPAVDAVETAPRPLVVAMVISIDGTHYAVAPLAPAPGATKAFRFTKIGGDEAQHDIDETATGASCDCGDFVWRHEGRDDLGCRHIRAARMLGLISEAPEPAPFVRPRDEFDEPPAPAPYDGHLAKLARLAEAEDIVRREGEGANPARDIVLIDAEAARDAFEDIAESEASVSRDDEDESWRYGPQDDGGGGWDAYDDDRWTTIPAADERPDRRTLAEQIDVEARHYRTIGTDFGDLMAETIEKLGAEVRYLDASTPAAYHDRREAALDAARDAAEARQAARCC